MTLADLRASKSPFKTLLILVGILWIQLKLIWMVPVSWDLPWIWSVVIMRFLSMASSLILIWILAPHALEKFKLRIRSFGPLFLLSVIAVLVLPTVFLYAPDGSSLFDSFTAIVFSLFIGLDEEFFNRGLVYGVLEKYGQEIAMALSAVIFGALHFSNYLYGEESFDYVLGHVVAAFGFGYFMAALMIAGQSIWLPVFIHGLTDIRWVIMDSDQYSEIVGGQTNWFRILVSTSVMVVGARLIVKPWQKTLESNGPLKRFVRFLGLVE